MDGSITVPHLPSISVCLSYICLSFSTRSHHHSLSFSQHASQFPCLSHKNTISLSLNQTQSFILSSLSVPLSFSLSLRNGSWNRRRISSNYASTHFENYLHHPTKSRRSCICRSKGVPHTNITISDSEDTLGLSTSSQETSRSQKDKHLCCSSLHSGSWWCRFCLSAARHPTCFHQHQHWSLSATHILFLITREEDSFQCCWYISQCYINQSKP